MASELGKRVGVAAVGIPLAILLLYIGGWPLALVLALLAAGGALELYRMARVRGIEPFDALGAALAAVFVLLAQAAPGARAELSWLLLIAATLLFAALAIFRRGVARQPFGAIATTVLGAVFVGGAMAYGMALRNLGSDWTWGGASDALASATGGAILLATPLALTWFGDTFAYFGGRAWGKRKLIPAVSPGKTVAGALSSLAGTVLIGALYAWLIFGVWLGVPLSLVAGAVLGLLVSITAQIGDLAESLLKREAGVKDSGHLLPGHGGILDRFDALLFTLPVTYWYLRIVLPGVAGF
jgi:phosphatidate cytidylyltransferase